MNSPFGHIILDFDGVLSDSLAVACEELNAISAQFYPVIPRAESAEDMARVYCGPLQTSLRRFGLSDAETKDFFDKHSAAMQARASAVKPFDDVVRVVAELPWQTCSIVTSSYSSAVREILAKSPNYKEGMFRYISGRELRQPKCKKITAILDAVGISSGQALHVGDTVSDLIYSRSVPIPFCAVGWGYHPLPYLRAFDPDFAVASAKEFGRLVKESAFETATVN